MNQKLLMNVQCKGFYSCSTIVSVSLNSTVFQIVSVMGKRILRPFPMCPICFEYLYYITVYHIISFIYFLMVDVQKAHPPSQLISVKHASVQMRSTKHS